MSHSITSSSKASHLSFILIVFTTLLSPFAHAQKFQPTNVFAPCSTFVEGQGLYVVGGGSHDATGVGVSSQAFMLDLSISWSTNNPVFKKLPDHPTAGLMPPSCTMTSSGGILTTESGTGTIGFLYDVKSNAKNWTKVSTSVTGRALATDPESGLNYVFANDKLTEVNLKTMKFKEYPLPASVKKLAPLPLVGWSSPMRSLLVFPKSDSTLLHVFTPSEANNTSHGWREVVTGAQPGSYGSSECLMPAYNGSKMISFDSIMARVYIFDVATLTWAVSPEMSKVSDGACGVSGDQVIFWGGWEDVLKLSNKTYIYNMKTGKWTSRYISPKDTPSTTGLQSPTQHGSSTTTPEPVDASQGLSKNVVNVAIAAGVIVVTALVAFSVYIGYRTRPNPDTESTGTSGSVSDLSNVCGKEQLEESHRFRGQDYPTPPPIGDVTVQTARLQQGSTGARDTQEHPHAIVKGSITGYSS